MFLVMTLTFQVHVTSEVMWPFDLHYAVFYRAGKT